MGGLPSIGTELQITKPAFIGSPLFDTKAGTLLAGFGQIEAGTALGIITVSGKLAPVARTTVRATSASGQKIIKVADASVFEVGDAVRVMQAEAVATVQNDTVASRDLTAGANTITITSYNLAYTLSAGDLVRKVDGSETAVGLLVSTDDSGTSSDDDDYGDKGVAIVIAGNVISGKCTGIDDQVRIDLNTAQTGVIYFSDLI